MPPASLSTFDVISPGPNTAPNSASRCHKRRLRRRTCVARRCSCSARPFMEVQFIFCPNSFSNREACHSAHLLTMHVVISSLADREGCHSEVAVAHSFLRDSSLGGRRIPPSLQ